MQKVRALFVLLPLALSACQRVTSEDETAAIECVRRNITAMESNDIEAVMATIHPKSPSANGAREQTLAIFDQFKLAYALENVAVKEARPDGIKVDFTMTTKKVSGPEGFTDNRVEGVHLLKRDDKQWKIWSTQVYQARALEDDPALKGE